MQPRLERRKKDGGEEQEKRAEHLATSKTSEGLHVIRKSSNGLNVALSGRCVDLMQREHLTMES